MDTGKTMTGTALFKRSAGLMMTPRARQGVVLPVWLETGMSFRPADLPMPCALVEQDPAHFLSVVPADRERIP
jgi:hypothetical protein